MTMPRSERAENDVVALLRDRLGAETRRAPSGSDGHIEGLTGWTLLCVDSDELMVTGVRDAPLEASMARDAAGTDFAATWLRLRGSGYRVILTVAQFCDLVREVQVGREVTE